MKLILQLVLAIGSVSTIKVNSEFPCGFKYTKENMIDEMDAFSRGLSKSRYDNAYDIAQKLKLKLPKVNTTAYYIQGFNQTKPNITNETDSETPVDTPTEAAITSLVNILKSSKKSLASVSSGNISLASESQYVQDQLETVKNYQDNLNSNPTNQVLVNAFINNTLLVKDGFLEKFDKATWMAPLARTIHNHVNTTSNTTANATANSTNSANSSSSTPASNSTVSANASSNVTAPAPSESLASPFPASVVSRKGNKVSITRLPISSNNATANVQKNKNPDQEQTKKDETAPIESSKEHNEKALPKMPISLPKNIPSPPEPPKSMTKFVDKIRGN